MFEKLLAMEKELHQMFEGVKEGLYASHPSPIDSDAYGVPERPIDQEPDPEFFADQEPDPDQERDDDLDHRHADEEAVAYDRATWY